MKKSLSGSYKCCLNCNKKYYVKPYLLLTSKYCSRSCAAKFVRIKIKKHCEICNIEFEHISSRSNTAKYCSRSCYYKSQHKKGTIIFSCQHCNKKFLGSPSDIGKRKFCSKECVNKSSKETFLPSYTTVRKTMILRNLIKKCNRCSYDSEPRILGVHHKDRNRNNNEILNLEVLCPNCHSLEHLKHIVSHQ